MWICRNCQKRNEENFKFCWSCGQARPVVTQPLSGSSTEVSFPKKTGSPPEEIPQVQKIRAEAKTDPSVGKTTDQKTERSGEKKKAVVKKTKQEPRQRKSDTKDFTESEKKPAEDEPLVFSFYETESPDSPKGSATGQRAFGGIDWEKMIFRIALRLTGLYLLVRVIISLPDLIGLIATRLAESPTPGDLLLQIGFPLARNLFYISVGFYLIISGRLLARLLPDR